MPAPVKPVSDSHCLLVYVEPHLARGTSGTWTIKHTDNPETDVPVVHCKSCSGGIVLAKHIHTIDDDGRVRPSIGCPWCGWHVFAWLQGWPMGSTRHP